MPVQRPVQFVRSATHLEIELLRQPAAEVEFESSEQEERYQVRNFALASQIEAVVCSASPQIPAERLLFASLDWWPNKSRSVVLSKQAFCANVLERLSDLLQGEYAEWRIHVAVCESLSEDGGDSEVGSLCILPGRVIVEESLRAFVEPGA
jgi:hypothetical protein